MVVGVLAAVFIGSTGCTSRTVIRSDPSGAKVLIDGAVVGVTPYEHSDSKVAFSSTVITLKKPGYQDFVTVVRKDEEFNAVACLFGGCCLFPYLWLFGYKSERLYALEPLRNNATAGTAALPAPVPAPATAPDGWSGDVSGL